MPFSSIAASAGGGATTDFGNKTGPNDANEQYNDGVATVSGYVTTDASGGTLGDGYIFASTPIAGDTQAIRLIVYADDGTGVHPSTTLVGVSDERVFPFIGGADTFRTITGWTSFGGAPVLAANTKYWLGAWWGTQTGPGSTKVTILTSDTAPSLIHGAGVAYSSIANPVVGAWGVGGTHHYDRLYFDITASGGGASASMRSIRRRGYA